MTHADLGRTAMTRQGAVFLDRDGVLNPDVGYPHRREDAVLYRDVIPALRLIERAGYVLVIVSNQSGIARGLFSADDARQFNEVLAAALRRGGVAVSTKNFYICPHRPSDGCACRKPRPGLLVEAARTLNLDLTRSFMVGDSESDIQAGRAAGAVTIRLNRSSGPLKTKADYVATDLLRAAKIIMAAALPKSVEHPC